MTGENLIILIQKKSIYFQPCTEMHGCSILLFTSLRHCRRYGTYIHKKNLPFQHPCFRNKLEKNLAFIRYILPKGSHFSCLTQEDATRMANHINSTARASLNGHTPFELAQMLLDKKLIELCCLTSISADQVILKPSLLK